MSSNNMGHGISYSNEISIKHRHCLIHGFVHTDYQHLNKRNSREIGKRWEKGKELSIV